MLKKLTPFGEDAKEGKKGNPDLLVDKDSKIIVMNGEFCLEQGPLEYLVVSKGPEAKLHETIIAVKATPRDIYQDYIVEFDGGVCLMTNIGDRYTKFSKALVLTAVLGNPPTFVQTLTAENAAVSPQSNVEYLLTSKVREAPFEMVLLPYSATVGSLTVNVPFTTT